VCRKTASRQVKGERRRRRRRRRREGERGKRDGGVETAVPRRKVAEL